MNSQQLEAYLHDYCSSEPLVVLAGAGSGKTTVMTRKLALLLASEIDSSEILGLTFTRKAALEMKNRIRELLKINCLSEKNLDSKKLNKIISGQNKLPWLTTFHSAAFRMLKLKIPSDNFSIAGYYHKIYQNGFTLLTAFEKQKLISRICNKIGYGEEYSRAVPAKAVEVKDELKSLSEIEAAGSDLEYEAFRFLEHYEKIKIASCVFDLQDLMTVLARLLRSHKKIRNFLQKKFKYIMVDEFQDTNLPQLVILAQLAEKHKNIFAVGDDYQAIYEWRGAKPEFISAFNVFFPEAKQMRLTYNYRSRFRILLAADSLFVNRKEKSDTFLRPARRKGGKLEKGERIALFEGCDGSDETEYLIHKLTQLNSEYDVPFSDCAVFYRLQKQKNQIIQEFKRKNIPFRVYGNKHFFSLAVPRSLLALCRILNILSTDQFELNKNLDNSLEQALRKWWFDPVGVYGPEKDFSVPENKKSYVEMFKHANEAIADDYCTDFAAESAQRIAGWNKFLMSGGAFADLLADLKKLLPLHRSRTYMKQFRQFKNWLQTCDIMPGPNGPRQILTAAALQENDPLHSDDARPAVNLMTMHCCKGMEYANVFIIGLEDRVCPCLYNISAQDSLARRIEEEKRLLYVGMTRARDRLYLSYAISRYFKGERRWRKPSRFLKLIPREFLEKRKAPLSSIERLQSWVSPRVFNIF